MKIEKKITIAIDGPAGAGKSTVSKAVARALGYTLVDTGAIYRSVALLAKRSGISWEDEAGLATLVGGLSVSFSFEGDANLISVNGEDLSASIRVPAISQGASMVSQHPQVRAGLLALQRTLAGEGGAVLEGRDIGTVVFPEAPVKVFLDASPEVRATRRTKELQANGSPSNYDKILQEIQDRDHRDRTRSVAPLVPAKDAIEIDCSSMSAAEVIEQILGIVNQVVSS